MLKACRLPTSLLNFRRGLASLPELPPCDFKPTKYEGRSQESMAEIRKEHVNPGILTYYRKPVAINQGHMQYLYDLKGNRYIDMIAGIATVIAGHCHPHIQKETYKQMDLMWHTSNIYLHPSIHEYAEALTNKLPDSLKVCYFVNSGSEANDLALFMSRLYTGCMDTFVLRGAYHGGSPVTMGLTSLNTWCYNYPSATAVHKLRSPDVYKGPWGGKACRDSPIQADRQCSCRPGECEAGDRYFEEVQDALKFCAPKDRMGAMFVESIQGVSGSIQFPKNWLKRTFEAVRARGGVCISDEVQTGFGRTGEHYWGFEGHDVVPDIVVMAKGIGNGFPLAAVVTTPEIAGVLQQAIHFNTFGGNPVACAVGKATLEAIDQDQLQENAHVVGTHFIKELAKLRVDFPIIGDVRGKGFMIAMELVNDRVTKDPLPAAEMADIFEDLKDMWILAGKGGVGGNCLRFKPPMCVSKDDVDYTVACTRIALQNNLNKHPRDM